MTTESTLKASKSSGPIVEMTGIIKRFPGVVANDRIDLELRGGEVHALLGENGAGKTTLMNVLYGLYRPDEGEIRVDGKSVTIRSPKDSIKLGIAMVHQHFALVDTVTVGENVVLGLRSTREPLLDLENVSKRIDELSKRYGLEVDSHAKIEQLSVGERQRVEIIKALYRNARILILDEPTSIITPQEAEELFVTLRSMASEGRAVVFITHKLPEVMAVSDRVTVLRHGKVVANIETKSTSLSELAEKELPTGSEEREGTIGKAVLEIQNLWAQSDKGIPALRDITLTVHEGEILGIAGVAGNGQRELAEVLTGMRKATQGKVSILGIDMTNASPGEFIEHRVGHIPEDRLGTALIMDFSISENLILEVRSKPPFSNKWFLPFNKRYFLNFKEIRQNAERLVREYDISTPNVDASARTLSGGNLQKLILAKILSRNPKLLVAAQPTSGLDVGAKQFISDKLRAQRNKGLGILLISGDLNEVMSLSDQIAVIYNGKIAGILPASTADVMKIGLMMGGAG